MPGFCRRRFPTTASTHRTSSVALAPVGAWHCLRRCCSQLANVVYFITAHFANFWPLIPLLSNSSRMASRRSRGVLTRPAASRFNIWPSTGAMVSVLAFPSYGIYHPLNQWCWTGRIQPSGSIMLIVLLRTYPYRSIPPRSPAGSRDSHLEARP